MRTEREPDLLVGDVGGTHARFARVDAATGHLHHERTLPTEAFPDLRAAVDDYLLRDGLTSPRIAAIAIANPVTGDRLTMTNNRWQFSIEATRRALGLERLLVLNDWEAMALALPALDPGELESIGPGQAVADAPRGLIGPGTGLGVSSLVRTRDGEWVAIPGEGGHVSLAPLDERQDAILRMLWRAHPHVSAERVVSGMGIENLHRAIRALDGLAPEPLDAASIAARAASGHDPVCAEAIEQMCLCLGGVAGNLALTLGARGGIYLGGGIVGRLGPLFTRSGFRRAFEAKGRFTAYLREIPTFVIRSDQPALIGAAMALGVRARREHDRARGDGNG
jgi:glucokinase